MENKNVLKISVGGQSYTLVTDDKKGEAKELAEDLDKKVTRLMKENAGCTYTQAVVLAALDYAQTAKHAMESEAKLRSEVRAYLEDSAKAKTERDKANRDLERLKMKLKRAHATPRTSLLNDTQE